MLKLAISHVNRLRPRFLVVSGDLTNAWPTISNTTELNASNAAVIDAQVASFREALRELDPSIPVVLQPGTTTSARTRPRVGRGVPRALRRRLLRVLGGRRQVRHDQLAVLPHAVRSAEAAALRADEAWVEDELSAEKTAGAAHVVLLALAVHGRRERGDGLLHRQRAGRRWLLRVASQPYLPRGRVTTVLCGHYHQNYTAWSPSGIESVTTSSAAVASTGRRSRRSSRR